MANPFRRRLVGAIKAVYGAVAGIFSGYGGQGGRGWRFLSPGAQYDFEAEAGDLWRNSAVAACLRVVRNNLPEPDLTVAVKDADGNPAPLASHPLLALVETPNDYYTSAELWAATALSLIVDGNAYWIKVRSPAGKVVQLWWVPHWMMECRYPADGSVYLTHYVYLVNGRQVPVRVEDVVHFRQGIDPRNDRLGLSDLKQGVREVCSDNEAAGYSAATLKNMGVPTVVITPVEDNGRFGVGQEEQVRQQWRQRLTGDNRGDPLVTDSVKVTKISLSPKELALADLPDRFEDRICALIGVNPMVAGLTSGGSHKTYANYAEARRAFYEDMLIPLLKAIAKTLTLQLLTDFLAPGGAFVRWCFKGCQCLRENENDVAKRAGELYEDKKLITLNEGRQAIGYKPVPGGDRFADGSTPEEGPRALPAAPSTAGTTGEEVSDEEAKSLRAEALAVIRQAKERMGAA